MMLEEEVKGGHHPKKERPRVHTTKACIVSMEYKIRNNNEVTQKFKPLGESYKDAQKVERLLKFTLGWDKEDVISF